MPNEEREARSIVEDATWLRWKRPCMLAGGDLREKAFPPFLNLDDTVSCTACAPS